MAKTNLLLNSFNTGEVSGLIESRSDLAKFSAACRTLENASPLVEGGAKKMPGTYFAGQTALGGAEFTGSISGQILTVTAVAYGVLQVGQMLLGAGIEAGTSILADAISTGFVSALGVSFTTPISYPTAPPNIVITIAGDGTGATASVGWKASGTYPSLVFTPTVYLNGGSGYTGATATVMITNGNASYPDGVTYYTCTVTSSGSGGTGTGGTGTYTLSNSQTVASETIHTAASGKSRLVPFQFSTIQGAVLELSQGVIRIWEAASEGEWSLGLALQLPTDTDYNPATAYVSTNIALLGPFSWIYKYGVLTIGGIFVAAPYGTTNAGTIPITVSTNTADTLAVTVTGSSPNQGINIALANATAANNAAAAIQAQIRALASLNSPSNNFVDLTAWTVTPDPIYYVTPWIVAPGYPPMTGSFGWQPGNVAAACTASNQYDQFPIQFSTLSWNSAYWESYDIPDPTPIELITPYLEADLFSLDCSAQSADVLWIFHPSYPPAVVERLSANLWSYSLSLPGQQLGEPAYRGTADVVKTGYSAIGQSITNISKADPCQVSISATNNVFIDGSRIYINLVAGMENVNQGEFLVSNFSVGGSGTSTFDLIDPDTGQNVDSTGYLAYVSGGFAVQVIPLFGSPNQYPACGALYQERLCVGGANSTPTQINGSVEDDYPDFISDPNEDDYAFQFTLVSSQVNQLLNMIGTPNGLAIGTSGGVWVVTGSSSSAISQTEVNASLQSTYGVSALQPQLINGSAIFVSRSARIVTFLAYNFVTNQWDNTDLTRLNRNITIGPSQEQSGIIQTAFQIEPYPIYWAVRNDGQLIGLVFNNQDEVYAWFRVNMVPEGGLIESVAVVSGQNQEDQVAIVVNRTINGMTKRYVEYFMPQEMFGQLSNAFFVHSGQQLQLLPAVNITGINNGSTVVVTAPGHKFQDGESVQIQGVSGMVSPTGQSINQNATQAYLVGPVNVDTFELQGMDTTTWSAYVSGGTATQVTNQVTGMSYLLGQTVTAVGDGSIILPPTVVTGDAVNFPVYANLITIGIPYKMIVEPMNPVLGSPQATSKSKRQKFSRANVSLYQCIGGQMGTDWSHLHNIDYTQGDPPWKPSSNTPPVLYTGNVLNDLDSDWGDSDTILLVHDLPYPFTLRSIEPRLSASEEG